MRVRLAALAALVALGLAGCTGGSDSPADGIVIGDGGIVQWDPGKGPELPAVSGTTLEGTKLDLASFKGDVTVVNLWGTWCGPCQEESPTLAAVAGQFPDVHFVGVDVRDSGDRTKAQKFLEKYRITYPSLDDADGSLTLAMRKVLVGAGSPPQTLVVGRDGRLVGRIAQTAEKSILVGLLQTAGVDTGSAPTPSAGASS
ncbi:thiol-disulfide isomerase/thioredoxin [Motilibacter peucedani]|uniref:Thiol-disulfide isomerase/thioredoxin n=1 Tax=Motilibacter peucedani TaxID=598650 RepID=A0A420XKU6_9ACTN|nr:TlpA disulfide reductase family protein [Motilibacter peucedani]RKS69166.1 thiol-disulfide isomerase/thioredoxin [Motilibacter peucedani]